MPLKTIAMGGVARTLAAGFCGVFVVAGVFASLAILWPPSGWRHYDPDTAFMLDNSAIQKFSTFVHGKHVSGGKTTRYELTVDPWGPVGDPDQVQVTREFYDSTKVGQRICVFMGSGRLGARWYDVGNC